MSLFGTSPDDRPSRSKSTLFDDEPTPAAQKTSASIFADDFNESADSPWALPTPKKAARGTLVKTLLPATDVPESYIDTYDTLLASDRLGSGISTSGIKRLLAKGNISADAQEKILHTVIPGGQEPAQGVGRGEFNVLLALIALAQEGEDITLDGVDERRRSMFLSLRKVFSCEPRAEA
jgi:sorting nexin-8